MFDLSGILKKYKETKNAPSVPQNPPSAAAVPVSVSGALLKDAGRSLDSSVQELYAGIVSTARRIYAAGTAPLPRAELNALPGLTRECCDSFRTHDRDLMKCVCAAYPAGEEYLPFHAANIFCMTLDLAIGLQYDEQRLVQLGNAGMLHDAGMIGMPQIVYKEGKLSAEETRLMKEHPAKGAEMVRACGIEQLSPVEEILLQEHERIDGRGYPRGLKGGQIHEYAQLIGLLDVYEALTHERPYRPAYSALNAVKLLLSQKGGFPYGLLKAFIERSGIFPVGKAVLLNTHETAVVMKNNPKSPLRPVVMIVVDAYGRRMGEPKHMDLSENGIIYIEECREESV